MTIIPASFFESKVKVLLALIIPPLLIYLKSLFFDFTTLDEQWMILQNGPFLESIESFKKAFTTPLAGLYYRPMLLITIIADYQIGKLSPFIYHFTNVAWHLLSVILLYRFFVAFEIEKKMAFICTLIFSVHPLTLHAVAWVPGRNDTILCVFVLASLICLKRYIDEGKNKFILFHLLFFLGSLATKENAIVLPVIYSGTLWIYKDNIKRAAGLFIFWIIMASAWFILRKNVANFVPSISANFLSNLKTTLQAISVYLGKMLYPVQLSVFPTLKNASLTPGFFALATLIFLYFKQGIKNKKIAFFGLAFFITLLVIPVWYSSSNPTGEHYEHRAYIPLIGILIFLSQLRFSINSKIIEYTCVLIIMIFSVRTFTRMDAYKNKEVFLSYAVEECPEYYLFQMQMGEMFNAKRDFENALIYYNRALKLRPDKIELHNNTGGVYYSLGRYREAIDEFTKAINSSKKSPTYYLNRCSAYLANGEINNAMKDLNVLMNCCKDMVPPDLEKEVVEKWVAAETSGLAAQIEKDSGNANLYFKRAQIYLSVGEIQKGLADLKKATELEPNNEEYLALYLKKSGELRR